MKISVWIPKGTAKVKSQLKSELSTASQIKNRQNRETVTNALNRLIDKTQDNPYTKGMMIFSDGEEIFSHLYSGKTKLFRADKEYIFPE